MYQTQSLNELTLIGRVGGEPQFSTPKEDLKLCKFSLATNEGFYDDNKEWQKKTTWHDVAVFGKLAEKCNEDIHKGYLVLIKARLKYSLYKEIRQPKIEVESIQVLTKK